MAKIRWWYVEVWEGHKSLYRKQLIDVNESKKIQAELKEKYPSPQYIVSRDYY
jgi:hypothetical protein